MKKEGEFVFQSEKKKYIYIYIARIELLKEKVTATESSFNTRLFQAKNNNYLIWSSALK